MDPEQQNQPVERSEGSSGPIIGTIIILVVIVLGGLYFWGQRDSAETEQAVEAIETQSESDAVADIEADLESTDVENLGGELDESAL